MNVGVQRDARNVGGSGRESKQLGVAVMIATANSDDRGQWVGGLERDPAFSLSDGTIGTGEIEEQVADSAPDLIIMDVRTPEFDGFEVLDRIASMARPAVIFIASDGESAVRAFAVGAVDYVVRPFSDARIDMALQRAKRTVQQTRVGHLTSQVAQLLTFARQLETATEPREGARTVSTGHLVLKAEGAHHFIKTSDVIWIEAQGDFVKVQTSDKVQLVRETLHGLGRRLDRSQFLRIHRSFVVNLDHITRVEAVLYGDYAVYMSDGSKLRLSRTYRARLDAILRSRS
ncbi:MAG: LytTR family DNA-binding domain-containing protein [Opitutus sp.]